MDVNGYFLYVAAFPRRERACSNHWIGGWVDPVAVLSSVKKNLLSLLVIEPPAIWSIAIAVTTELFRL